ncbi:hypothetical protein KXJ69_11080 [Aureisphaera sp. CAU 1614]|uniref:Uncharacterized protein n=1 Tax=Halomarinibacterium sedimenti TaxID=2857106 RepID=A0A9X1FPZ2_9FLAO|nr:hypothetical protein [Halomarinibacterium sedimenti]MBW2938653.1 hypothetical protein [Halomarinibacterium sedimenti]
MKNFKSQHFFFFVMLFFFNLSFGQNDNFYTKIQEKKIRGEQYWDSFKLYEEALENAEGSPYANPDFLPGRLYKGKESVSNIMFLRYNGMSDEIEVKPTEGTTQIQTIIKDPEIFAKVGDEMYMYVESENPDENGGYFKIVKDLQVYDLVKKVKITFKEAQFAKTSYDKNTPAQFITETTYFLTDDKGTFYELPNSKAKILKVMAKKKSEVKAFMQKGNIDITKENDLSRLVTYFNSLL